MVEKETKRFRFEIPEDDVVIEYNHPSELQYVIWREADNIGWANAQIRPDEPSSYFGIRRKIGNAYNHADAMIEHFLSATWDKDPSVFAFEINRDLGEIFRIVPLSMGARGKFIDELKSRGEVLALGALAEMLAIDADSDEPEEFREGRRAAENFLLSHRINSSFRKKRDWAHESQKHEEAYLMLEQRFENLEDTANELAAKIKALSENADIFFGQQEENSGKKFEEIHKTLDSLSEEFELKLSNLEKAYSSDKALEAPAKFWETKRSKHTSAAGEKRRILIWFAGLSVSALAVSAALLLSAGVGNSDKPIYWLFGIAGLVATGVIWTARVLVRLYLTELHLVEDSAERITMANTYIALVKGGYADGQDMSVILNALFRPSSDGLVKEEQQILTPLEIVTRLVSREGK